MKKKIKVVAAIIENEQREILCALRSPSMSIPNHWEFPGGKVEEGEDLFHAITREIAEELQCDIEPIELFNEHTHEYESFIIELLSLKCALKDGTPVASEHAALLWLKRESLHSLQWAPADIPAVNDLQREQQ
ncbi:NUDIX hydrolase [Fictibacillus macauensis ZFHKF-1]|uniref:8-oxo-dGTP diphosphatase n=1 Tax=Fictibacillus macauensis ZFHKF-1 TaxID=1196324 RepID=I8IZC8_9BACL|nr:(deoxy)nucleoside triphosphate pyrophosphohydrolase [Fictibacillus macauensis]EIT84851.1 NUDIX hydrolase [Fictibacillus macauensis ZFHKF-1]